MLGQPVSMLIPRVVGFKLTGEIPAGATATDVVLTITEMLRRHGVVGKFVEFYGEGVGAVPLANRATIGNMSPEFGSTAAIFPIDEETMRYLKLTGRSGRADRAGRGVRQGAGPLARPGPRARLLRDARARPRHGGARRSPGPKRPQDRIALTDAKPAFRQAIRDYTDDPDGHGPDAGVDEAVRGVLPGQRLPGPALAATATAAAASVFSAADGGDGRPPSRCRCTSTDRGEFVLDHGAVVIASITLVHQHVQPVGDARRGAAGQERRREGPRGQAVGEDVDGARLARSSPTTTRRPGSGRTWRSSATTSSATAAPPASATPGRCRRRSPRRSTTTTSPWSSVLSGNRNFEGRINPDVKMNYLASPAARDRLRARRHDGLRLRRPQPLGTGVRRQRRCTCTTSGPRPPTCSRSSTASINEDMFTEGLRRRLRRRRAVALAADAGGRRRSSGTPTRPTCASPRTSTGMADGARAGRGHRRRPGARAAGRLGDHRPHLPRGLDQGRHPGRAVPRRARRGEAGLQLLRLAAAATTR